MINPPWQKQRILKAQDIPLHESIIGYTDAFTTLQEKALFVVAYLTAGRISEVVQQPFLRKHKYFREQFTNKDGQVAFRVKRNENGSPMIESTTRVPLDYLGVKKKGIMVSKQGGMDVLVISMQNRKNKKFTLKNIPISLNKEKPLIDLLYAYLATLDDEAYLFPFKTWKAEKILAVVGLNPHFIRDIRLTHMVTMYGYNSFQLQKFAGWKNSLPAERYVRLGVGDLVSNF